MGKQLILQDRSFTMKKFLFLFILTAFYLQVQAQLPGNSLQLNADGNFVSVPDAASASLSNDMTIEAWVYTKCTNANSTFVLTKGWCGSTWSYYFSIFDKKLRLAKWPPAVSGCAGGHAMFESLDSMQVNTWTHVAVVVNGLSVTFYINGADAGSTLLSGTNAAGFHTSNQPLRISNYVNLGGTNSGTIKGNVDDVRLWHTARTQAEIFANMGEELTGTEPGLYAYWKLNESGSGAGIVVANSAVATGATTNGTTVGNAANLQFVNNANVPNGLPTCDPILWLKADAGVVTNGLNEVTQWTDQSGFNNHAVSDGTTLPVLLPGAINNKPVINFTDDRLATPLVNLSATNRTEVFVVYKGIGVNGFTPMEFSDDGNVVTTGFYISDQDNTCPGCMNDVAAGLKGNVGYNQNSLNQTQGCAKIINVSYDKSLATEEVKIWLNGILQAKTPGTTNENNTNNFGTHKFYLGKRSANCAFCPGVMGQFYYAEIIVFNRTLTIAQKNQIKNYLQGKYFSGTAATFTALPANQTYNDALYDDNVWKHSYNTAAPTEIITSVKDNCLVLGSRNDTVYVEATALPVGNSYYMRRHYVINTALNPAGSKRVRLYYSMADFADLQSVTGLTSHGQLCVTKYDGPGEDGTFNNAGGTLTFIPAAQITTGTAFGKRYLEFDVNGFSEFWIHTGNTPLPLQLLSFTGRKENAAAILNWSAADVQQVAGFEVEKSKDARVFETIGYVKAGNAGSYRFTDPLLTERYNYYRLKMLDEDGQYTYSKTVMILNGAKSEFKLYPNPAGNEVNLTASAGAFSYVISDLYGHEMHRGFSATADQRVNCSSYAKGVYVIRIAAGDEISTLKFVKQ